MASTSRPQSVRGLYTPPAEEWVFLPPTVPPPSSTSSTPSTPVHLPTPFSSSDDTDLPGMSGMYGPLQLFTGVYFATALGMPFEVGKTLLQIEYRPRKKYAPIPLQPELSTRPPRAEELEVEDEDSAAAYFSDRLSGETYIPPPEVPDLKEDEQGYVADPDPTWLLKDDFEISRGNGVWGMIRRLRYTPSEGLPSLWKGQIITTLHTALSNILQPSVHTFLMTFSPSSAVAPDLPLAAIPNPLVPLGIHVGSHLLTHLILSPMEVLRTRLIAMPSLSSTPSSISLFNRMINNEGGLSSLYFHPNLFLPAVLEHTLRPLLTLSIPLLLERQFGISPDLSPVTYSLCDLSLNLASLVLLLPIETVRRRLQIQSRGGEKERIRTVVKVREREYVGIVEAMWRIVTEETGVRRRRVMSEKDEGGVIAGLRQLYRGFGMAATAHVTVFGLGLVSTSLGGRGFDGGWKEI